MGGDPELSATTRRRAPRTGKSQAGGAGIFLVYPRAYPQPVPLGVRTVLGRASAALCPGLANPTVSREHLEIAWDAGRGGHVCRDLGSSNGSWLGLEPMGPEWRALADQDVLRLGDVIAIHELAEPEAAPPGPAAPPDPETVRAIPGDSARIDALRRWVTLAGRDRSPVLIWGETGAGKEAIAHEVHRLSGRRGALHVLNCAALSPELVESQLFGHERGAFTGAVQAARGLLRDADGASVFLDEIGELPLGLQPKLLRTLQNGEVQTVGQTRPHRVDVRAIAATNRDLRQAIDAGTFRQDLYARLAMWELRVPPLRECRRDILPWIARLHADWARERPGADPCPLAFDADAAHQILASDWPLNLRDLQRLVHRLAAVRPADGAAVGSAALEGLLARRTSEDASVSAPSEVAQTMKLPAPTSREELEAALARHGSVRAVARHYGRDRRQVYRWLAAFGLREP